MSIVRITTSTICGTEACDTFSDAATEGALKVILKAGASL
jgi:hypothetical protein